MGEEKEIMVCCICVETHDFKVRSYDRTNKAWPTRCNLCGILLERGQGIYAEASTRKKND